MKRILSILMFNILFVLAACEERGEKLDSCEGSARDSEIARISNGNGNADTYEARERCNSCCQSNGKYMGRVERRKGYNDDGSDYFACMCLDEPE